MASNVQSFLYGTAPQSRSLKWHSMDCLQHHHYEASGTLLFSNCCQPAPTELGLSLHIAWKLLGSWPQEGMQTCCLLSRCSIAGFFTTTPNLNQELQKGTAPRLSFSAIPLDAAGMEIGAALVPKAAWAAPCWLQHQVWS